MTAPLTVDQRLFAVPNSANNNNQATLNGNVSTNSVFDNSGLYQTSPQVQAVTQQPVAMAEATRAPENLGEEVLGVNKCTDGKDDGKIGFFAKIGNALKGIGKMALNMVDTLNPFSKNFSPGKALLTVGAVAAAIFIPGAGVAMAVIGGAMAAKTIVEGGIKASQATTDADAKDAWENIGAGTAQLGLSYLGAKAGLKAAGVTKASLGNALKHPIQTARAGLGKVGINKASVGNAIKHPIQTAKAGLGKAGNATKAGLGKFTKAVADNKILAEAQGSKISTLRSAGQVAKNTLKNSQFAETYRMNRTFENGVLKSTYAAAKDGLGAAYTKANTAATSAGYSSLLSASTPSLAYNVKAPNSSNQPVLTTPYTEAATSGYSGPTTFGYDVDMTTPTYFDPSSVQANDLAYQNFMYSNGAYTV